MQTRRSKKTGEREEAPHGAAAVRLTHSARGPRGGVVDSYGGYRVQPFEGDQWDEELLRVPGAVEAAED